MRCLAVLVAVLGFVAPSFAQDPGPTVEIRVRSVTELLAKVEYLGTVLNQGEAGKQAAEFVRGLADEKKGIEGIDPFRPIGLYATLTPNVIDSPVVLLIPVSDSDAVLDALSGKIGLAPKRLEGGVYQIEVPNVPAPVFFRFENKYAYLTVLSEKAIAKSALRDPVKFFDSKGDGIASAKIHLDRIPADVKKVVLGQIELKMADAKKVDGESPARGDFRAWAYDQAMAALKTAFDDGTTVGVRLNVEPKTDDLTAEVTFAAKDGTPTQKLVQGLNARPVTAAALPLPANPLASVSAKLALPELSRKYFEPIVDGLIKDTIENAKEDDKVAQKMLFDALAPTFKAAELDAGFAITGPDAQGHIGALVALKVTEGDGIVKTLREFAQFIPEDKAKFEFDSKKLGTLALHKLTINADEFEGTFGTKHVWLATSDEFLVVSFAEESKAIITAVDAITKPDAKARPAAGTLSFARLVALTEKGLRKETIAEVIDAAFGKTGPVGKDTAKLTIDGGDKLMIRFNVKGSAVRFATMIDAEKKK